VNRKLTRSARIFPLSFLLLSQHWHIKGASKRDDLNGSHLPEVTIIPRITHAEHLADGFLFEGHDLTPLVHQGGDDLDVDVEDDLALVSRYFD